MNYTAIIPYKIKGVVQLIMENKQKAFVEAIDYLYSSNLYEHLSDEESKFWHFSSAKLFYFLEQEKQNAFANFSDLL